LDVDLGLVVGLVVSILFLIAWGYFPIVELVGRTEYQDLYLQADSYHSVISNYKISQYFKSLRSFFLK